MTTGITLGTSGLDIEQLVENSMKVYQSKYDKAYKKEQKAEWTKSAYADIYSALKTFQETAASYKLTSSTGIRKVTSSSTAVTATALGTAATMAHTVTVSKLASSAYLQTANGSTVSKDGSIKLADIADVTGLDSMSDEELAKTALSFTISDGNSSKTISYTYLDLKGETDENGNTTTEALTLNDLASSIRKSGLNLYASYDSTNDSFSLYNTETGEANTIQVTLNSDASGSTTAAQSLFDGLGLASYDSSTDTLTAIGSTALYDGSVKGVNSEFTVDGKTYSKNSNSNTINNVTYAFTNTTDTAATLTVSLDTDSIVDKVQAFVDAYNNVLDTINTATHESKYSDYEPLTDEEKADMSESEITAWEKKAKSGLLKNDSMLTSIVSSMRSSISESVSGLSGSYTSLYNIGITASSDYTDYGKISLDTDTLEKALAEDPDCVYNLFSTKGSDSDSNGIAYRLYDISTNGMSTIKDQAGTSASYTDDYKSVLGLRINNMLDNLDTLKDWLDDKEDYFYTKYNKMESAMSSISSQLSTITGMLGTS